MSASDVFSRRNRIVELIVEVFIETGEPIGSLALVQEHRLGVSSATIRNIMAALEGEGLITHPYTSAGRLPTDLGYRYYVDRLMKPEPVHAKEARFVEETLRQSADPEDLWELVGQLVSELTGEAGFVLQPRLRRSTLKQLNLMLVGPNRLVAFLVMQPGFVRPLSVSLAKGMALAELERLVNFFNREFAGRTLDDIRGLLERQMLEVEDSLFHLMRWAKALLEPASVLEDEETIHWEGLSRLIQQPELHDPKVTEGFLRVMEFPQALVRVLEEELDQPGVRIRIGREQPLKELEPFTMVTAPYGVGAQPLGAIGVLGPKRMPYAKAVSRVELVAQGLSRRLEELVT